MFSLLVFYRYSCALGYYKEEESKGLWGLTREIVDSNGEGKLNAKNNKALKWIREGTLVADSL